MSMHTMMFRRAAAAAGLAGLLLVISPATGQNPTPPRPPTPEAQPTPPKGLVTPSPTPPPPPPEAPQTGPVISIDFGGGLLRDYVASVREAAARAGRGVNIILPKEAENEAVPAISLTNVSVATALQSLAYAFPADTGAQIRSKSVGGPGDQTLTFAMEYARRGVPGMPVLQPAPVQRISRVYSLRSLVEMPDGVPPDPSLIVSVPDVLSALEAAAELEAKANDDPRNGERVVSPPEFLLHKESNLLICRGTENQQRLVESMLTELRESITPRRARAAEHAKNAQAAEVQKIAIKAELQQAEVEVKRARDQYESLRGELDKSGKRAEAGMVSSSELETVRRAAANAQSNVEQATAMYEAARAKAELLSKQAEMMPAGAMSMMQGGGQPSIEVTYEVRDLENLLNDLYAFCRLVIPGKWNEEGAYSQQNIEPHSRPAPGQFVLERWKSSGRMVLNATPAQHKVIVQYLNTVRRAKANEPNLPGLDADQLIRGAAGK